MHKPINVLVVDDSPSRRSALAAMLSGDPGIKIVGKAVDGVEAVEMARSLRPSVITMDFMMPRLDGAGAIRKIMAKTPTPIIVVSVTIENQRKFAFKCLKLGALDFVPIRGDMERMAEELIEKVKMASKVKVVRHIRTGMLAPVRLSGKKKAATKLVVVAVSTGGPQALEKLLPRLPAAFPAGIVIVQHIADGFSKELAEWLDDKSKVRVKEAVHGEKIETRLVLIAPGGRHLSVEAGGLIRLSEEPRELANRPSADILLESAAKVYGRAAMGIIMTGMGRDGARGIKKIKEAGGRTIAQDEESSVVFGMNKAAIEDGSIDRIVPLKDIPERIMDML